MHATGTTRLLYHMSLTTVNVWRKRQALVNNKFMGYAFAMALGASPSVENPAHPKYGATGVGHAERVREGRQCAARLCRLAWRLGDRGCGHSYRGLLSSMHSSR